MEGELVNKNMSTTCTKEQCDPRKDRRSVYRLGRGKIYFCKECFEEENALRMKINSNIGLGDWEDFKLVENPTELAL